MEKLVYTQDPIFTQKIVDFKFVEKRQEYESVTLDTGDNATSPHNCAVFDTRNLTPDKLIIYYEVKTYFNVSILGSLQGTLQYLSSVLCSFLQDLI